MTEELHGTTAHQTRIREFLLRARQECPLIPMAPGDGVRRLRATVIFEEALEAIQALGFSVSVADGQDDHEVTAATAILTDAGFSGTHDLPEIIKECADLSVVAIGTMVACGVRDQWILELVDENNLAKTGPGATFREDGKILKPPGFQKPDIARALRDQGWQG